MKTDLAASIVRILRSDKKTTGTGFLVAEGLIVTCAHVISAPAQPREGIPGEEVTVVFLASGQAARAEVVAEWWRPADGGDVAFLRLKEPMPAGLGPLPLGSSRGTGGHAFQTLGFPSASPEEGIWADGHILAETLMQDMRVLQLSSPQVTTGFSGAPVFDTISRRVVGMVSAIASQDEHGRMAETAFITPTETLRMICPQLTLSDLQPYLGLAAFGEADAEFFFGRKREVEKLLASLREEPRFLAVLGPSGSGKSSVIGAGLIPRLRRGSLPGSDLWGIISVRPGNSPLNNLEAEGLEGASQDLAEAARSWLARNPDMTRLVIILDQFEELLATASQENRQDFMVRLKALLDLDLPVTLLLIMRDDFFSRFALEAPSSLFEWVQRGFAHISASLEEEELKEIIEGPARKVGLQFEEGLAEAVVRDVLAGGERAGRSTILPLLEFALTELWRRRRDGYLTHEAYAAIGGVTGSLTQWADQAYHSLAKEGLGEVARRVLTELVNLGDERQGIPDSRRRRTLEDFGTDQAGSEAARKVVMRLADARLITTSFDQQNKQETVEIIHDSLIREWRRLRQWLREDRSFLAWDREIEKKASAWEEGKRDEGRLLRGIDLYEAESWREKRGQDLGEDQQRFIAASLELRGRERQEKERRRKQIVLGLAAFSALALILAGAAVWQWNLSEQKTEEALALYLATQSEQTDLHFEDSYMTKILLAVESLRHKETVQVDDTLRGSLALLSHPLVTLDNNIDVLNVAFSPDGKNVVTGSEGSAKIWDAKTGKELHTLRHNGEVSTVAFSPNKSRVVTGSSDGTVKIWDTESGENIYDLIRPNLQENNQFDDNAIKAIAFSADGTKLAIAGADGIAKIWNAKSGEKLTNLIHSKIWFINDIQALSFSPNGTNLVTAGLDGTAKIWDIESSKKLHDLPHNDQVNAVAFSPDGSKIVTGGNDNAAIIWDAESGEKLHNLPHDDQVNAVAFSPDGSKIVTGSNDNIAKIWDAESGEKIKDLPHDSWVREVAFSPNGTIVATSELNGRIKIWDVESGQEIQWMLHNDAADSIAFSPDGSRFVTGSYDGTAKIWDTIASTEPIKLPLSGLLNAVALSPDGYLVATASSNGDAIIWDAKSGKKLKKLHLNGSVNSVAFSPNGTRLVTGSNDNMAVIWDISSRKKIIELPHNNSVTLVAFGSKDDMVGTLFGSRGIITIYDDLNGTKKEIKESNGAEIWNANSGKKLHELHHDDMVNAMAFSPDGSMVVTGSSDEKAKIWDVKSGRLLHNLSHNGSVNAVAFNLDGTKVVTGSSDGTARIWDTKSGEKIQDLNYRSQVMSVAFSSDESRVAIGGTNIMAQIWDAKSGNKLLDLPHDEWVDVLAFSSDGTLIATGGRDDKARIWDTATGQELHRLVHSGDVTAVAFSPDGNHLITSDSGGSAWIWSVSYEMLISAACDHVVKNFTAEQWNRYLDESNCMTCPREGRFNKNGFDFLSRKCQPCIAD